mmetsp:Transcript_7213/g.6321  ORF Transcript_7213/g.6321 Transcript_7213/m.6321 type:complete len:108 (+) Transcript_7213:2093-2416(+)|eukprot:CAMPEP_0170559652 /NCGR_PEP_ID=MMETSP0211-20121228/44229_1 /TAXON_ID=311385 /ORGANISM="Pseudokeronopsis sp., Strain OXSARD2" /LENGTH=107 /DNA_ID=CAMNT_0010872955 /DNA_START=2040 /DNA_END=2363 /DNA_ORIENTATION=-
MTYDKGYQERLQTRKKENETLHKGTLAYKTSMHDREKEFYEHVKENNAKRNPFNAKINQESLQRATRMKEKQMMAGMQMMEYEYGMEDMENEGGLLEDDREPMDEID